MNSPRAHFLPRSRPLVLPQRDSRLRKWASALVIVLIVAGFFALLAIGVICGILPGEFVKGKP